MSRSIHATRRAYLDERKLNYSDKVLHRRRLVEMREATWTKRRIKSCVAAERRSAESTDSHPAHSGAPRVRVIDESACLFYPATPVDIRNVLQLLPPGVLDGIAEVRLLSGRQRFDEQTDELDERNLQRDPWLGRLGHEIIPGVFEGAYLGVYLNATSAIEIYAYVSDPSVSRWPAAAFFLKLVMLEILVHEIVHHDDRMRRVAAGRWRFDDMEKNEHYAETASAYWLAQYVIPYLEQTYASDAAAWHAWVREHTGTSFRLREFATDWRWVSGDVPIPRQDSSVYTAVTDLAHDLHGGVPPLEARVNFARELHFGEIYDKAMEILGTVLSEEPAHLSARTLVADILEHQMHYDEAEALARELVAIDPESFGIWYVLCQIHESHQDWRQLVETTTACLAIENSYAVLDSQTRAYLELGEDAAFEANLEALIGMNEPIAALRFRALRDLSAGRLREAFRCSDRCLRRWPGPCERAVLAAIRFEAACRLGLRVENRDLDAASIALLRRTKYGPWAERLASEFGLRVGSTAD